MLPFTILLVVLSAAINAFVGFRLKKSGNKIVFVLLHEILGTIVLLPLFLYFLLIETVSTTTILFAMISGFVHAIYWIFLSKAYEKGDLSYVFPITKAAPGFILIFAIMFLGENVSLEGAIGVIIIVLGIMVISNRKNNYRKKLRETVMALFAMMSIVIYSLLDKKGVDSINPVAFLFLFTFFLILTIAIYILLTNGTKAIRKEWKISKKIALLTGSLNLLAYCMILIVFVFENVSYVIALRQLSVLFAVIIGGQILKEDQKWIRLFAASLIIIGSIIISLFA
ncbi:MAG: EamA family transporter [Candidatus Peribacteraceae bacterium]|nr:EamA family transporter [Candidatus Peribacteraceae bacterium]